jgi:hypothetical protein
MSDHHRTTDVMITFLLGLTRGAVVTVAVAVLLLMP